MTTSASISDEWSMDDDDKVGFEAFRFRRAES